MKKSYKKIALSLLLFPLLASYTSVFPAMAQENGEVIELDFWTFWGSEPRRNFIETIVDKFNQSQDEIHVNHTYLPWGDIFTKNLASIAAGEPADVIVNDINTVAQRAQKNQNTNLSEFIAQEGDEFASNFYENLWDVTLYEGDNYAIPFTTDTRLLYYNKDMMEEVGLDPEQPPTTWEELQEMAMMMDVANGDNYDRIGYVPRYGVQGDFYYMNATGHGFWDFESDRPTINDPEGVAALKWVSEYENHYGSDRLNAFTAEFGNQQADPFMNGKIGMMIKEGTHYSQIAAYAPDLNFGVTTVPEFEDSTGGHTSWGGGFVVEIPYGADNPEASWEFIKFLTDQSSQEYWAVNNFDNVANISAAETAQTSDSLSDKGQEVYQAAVENMEYTILTPQPMLLPDLMTYVNTELDNIYLGYKSPQQALDDAQAMVESMLP